MADSGTAELLERAIEEDSFTVDEVDADAGPVTEATTTAEADAAALSLLVPSAAPDPILRTLCDAIRIVHDVGPKMWSVTIPLPRRVLRLNFGASEVFRITPDGAWFPLPVDARARFKGVKREQALYEALAPANALWGAHAPIAAAFERSRLAFRRVIEQARNRYPNTDRYLNPQARRAHRRGLLAHLERRLRTKLPRPGWDAEAFESAAGATLVELSPVLGEEGGRRLRVHAEVERDAAVSMRAKERWGQSDPHLRCEVCDFSFVLRYGIPYVEAHHRVPLSKSEGRRPTRLDELARVCANCHRALHSSGELTVEQLRARILEVRS